MICLRCQTQVPDESTFCLSCGARLVQLERLAPVNGGGPASPAAAEAAALRPSAQGGREGQEGKQAYALSFRPLVDERLRYRVARWVCEHAPAHPLTEVQDGLMRGDFFTFLALTHEEAEAARQGIHGLGVAPALVHLVPATGAEMRFPEPRVKRRPKDTEVSKGKWVGVLLALGALLILGLVAMRLFGGRGF